MLFSLLLTGEQWISNCSNLFVSQSNLKTKSREINLVCLFSEKSYSIYDIFNKKYVLVAAFHRHWQCVLGEWNGKCFTLKVMNGSQFRRTTSDSVFVKTQWFYFGSPYSVLAQMLCSAWLSHSPHLIFNYMCPCSYSHWT